MKHEAVDTVTTGCHMIAPQQLGQVLTPNVIENPRKFIDLVGGILLRDMPAGAPLSAADVRGLPKGMLRPFSALESLEPLVALDRRVFAEFGLDYASEPWSLANFEYPLPNKPSLSFVFIHEDCLVGFWVASERVPGEAHTHRVAVDSAWRKGHITRHLFAAFWRTVVTLPHIVNMTVEMGSANERARRFYQTLGYQPVGSAETRDYLLARKRDDRTEGEEIVDVNGARSIVMVREV